MTQRKSNARFLVGNSSKATDAPEANAKSTTEKKRSERYVVGSRQTRKRSR